MALIDVRAVSGAIAILFGSFEPRTGELIDKILQSALELSPLTVYVVQGVLCWAEV
ncbi:hypothetical protein SR882_07925 [Guyparkeria halophila]|uniref:Uncharacterized protein n=1 Tax=Guyparkeria halophila TaxID=47960 RepID=A0ABZ0YU41_9GAMM|nr:hypothetical protein [Guyparkeria halophila]WQH15691.1 hypothetical protein SR882_07925 [Guyparkeria halophila]